MKQKRVKEVYDVMLDEMYKTVLRMTWCMDLYKNKEAPMCAVRRCMNKLFARYEWYNNKRMQMAREYYNVLSEYRMLTVCESQDTYVDALHQMNCLS